ncbi:DUF3114 domain-containing protein [Weissella bombi]|uniref:DUF3114 domain-containing protein n=1 Tax=Weissella bombi TaxID=1505725 RepID=A0A1C4AF01_9LACO|nr:DUF3114 domain-containing protein [Weissella bombi]SCB93099.1 Protein of unknown function [Weissella bombi]
MTGLFKRTRELIKSPKKVDKRRTLMTATLSTQTTHLVNDGWLPKSIAAYVDEIFDNEQLSDETMQDVLSTAWSQAHRVGSALFTKMYVAGFHRGGTPATDRLEMLYSILGMTVGSTNFVKMTKLGNWPTRNENQNADLYYLHVENMAEVQDYLEFVKQVAFMMRLKHHAWNGINSKYETSRQLDKVIDNQLRYYLSKPVVDLIQRDSLKQEDVAEGIVQLTGTPVSYPKADFHNRGVADKSNVKMAMPGYHLELIFDGQGELVSMWTALEAHETVTKRGALMFSDVTTDYSLAELQMIANTESTNYANAGGQIHQSLDVKPANRHAGLESELRNFAKNKF